MFMPKSHVHFMSTKIFKELEALVAIDNSKNSTESYKLVILKNVCILQHFSKLSSFFLHKFISRQSFILPNFLYLLKILILLVLLLRRNKSCCIDFFFRQDFCQDFRHFCQVIEQQYR